MKISTRTEYGMRVLVQLARHHGQGPLSLACIARDEKLPHAYLERLVSQLRRGGLVTATRGHAGGYELARPPVEISLADAVRVLDGPLLEMPCAGIENLEVCDRPMPCSVHGLFLGMYQAMHDTLGATTLADAAASPGGPPYPTAVRRRRLAQHAALVTAAGSVAAK
jgi:Rrf2 family cysteine metabolism transcriptional repressor